MYSGQKVLDLVDVVGGDVLFHVTVTGNNDKIDGLAVILV